jgi:hypothetical protein
MRELLLLLCRYPFNEKDRETLDRLISEVVDWHRLMELINAHGIIALAAYNIKEAGLEKKVPADVMVILESGYMQSIVRNTWLTERWKEINTILSNAGIKHVLLKGMALENTLYGSKGLRQMSDNDILMKREDALKAWHLLQKEGFTHELIKSSLHKKIMLDIGKHLPSLYKDGYSVEIHHRLFNRVEGVERVEKFEGVEGPTSIPPSHRFGGQRKLRRTKVENEFFENAEEINIGDAKALILSKEMQLKYLISHYERHVLEGNCQLRLYADIKLLDEKSSVNMPDHFISEPSQENKPEYRKAAYKINLNSIDPKFRLRFLTGDIFPSIKWMKKRYGCNGMKALFYYPQRIGKLIWLIAQSAELRAQGSGSKSNLSS